MEYNLMYLRKSRSDSEYETVEETLVKHERQLQEYAINKFGHRIPEELIYREVVSGETIEDRPEMKEVLKRIEDPECKGVIVIEPARLSRGDLYDLGVIMHAFRYSKTLILTPKFEFDLDNQRDREYFERDLLRGKDYVEYVKEILNRGKEAAAKNGNYIASVPPFGYDRVKDGKSWTLVINEKEAPYVKLIFEMYLEGNGAGTIAHKLNDLGIHPRKADRFKEAAIRHILTNEVYTGKIRWKAKPVVKVYENGKVIKKRFRSKDYQLFEGKHDAIISDEIFEAAKIRKGKVTREKTDLTLKNPYAGLLKCKKCGSTISYQGNKGGKARKERYMCRSSIYCPNKSSNVDLVQNKIKKALTDYLEDFRLKIDVNDNSHIENQKAIIKTLETEIEEMQKRQDSLFDFLEQGIYTPDVFKKRSNKLNKEIEDLKYKLKKAKQTIPEPVDYEKKYYSLYEAINALDNPTISAKIKNNLLKEVIEVIYYEKDVSDKSTPKGITESDNINLEIVLK